MAEEFEKMMMDQIDERILKAMTGGGQQTPLTILSQMPSAVNHDVDEIKGSLERMAMWGYVKISKKRAVVHQAEITERGRLYLRKKGE